MKYFIEVKPAASIRDDWTIRGKVHGVSSENISDLYSSYRRTLCGRFLLLLGTTCKYVEDEDRGKLIDCVPRLAILEKQGRMVLDDS
jgi:hypothetical protein